ncbi:MAG: molecular chaperone DnaJ [Crocinitomicaceae bacterium]|nr:molecular chaperone DnaJ [Crocinitomicaceae bacterium]
MMTEAYPLSWPQGFKRTAPTKRRTAPFGKTGSRGYKQSLTTADGLQRLIEQLELMGAINYVISTNVELRNDGLPRSGRRAPDDPGVAIYFQFCGKAHCLPCDRWNSVADNLAAVAKHIEALRGMDRWGVGDLEMAFAGFKTLPPPGGGVPVDEAAQHSNWWDVLGVDPDATPDKVRDAFRRLAKKHHPDTGGDPDIMAELNTAYQEGMKR